MHPMGLGVEITLQARVDRVLSTGSLNHSRSRGPPLQFSPTKRDN